MRVVGGRSLWNSCDTVKKPAAESVTASGASPAFSQYQPWIPGKGAVNVPEAVATPFRFS